MAVGLMVQSLRWLPPSTLNLDGISRLVALAMVDSKVMLLQPTFMPNRAATAFMKTNGEIWHQVIRSLPEWSLNECERLSRLLLREHRSFLSDFVRVLLDESASTFQQPPYNFPLRFSSGKVFSFDLPYADIDTSEFQRLYGGLEHHKIVRLDYERDRYMQHLSHDQLMKRTNDIMRNIHQIDEKGRVSLDINDPRTYYWMDRFTEMLQESKFRQIPYEVFGRAAIKEYPYPKDGERPRRIASLIAANDILKKPYLVRYGKYNHIFEAYKYGRIRLAAATSYSDTSLNPAMRDEELTHRIELDTRVFRIVGPEGPVLSGRLPIKRTLNTNFYVLCTSLCLKTRLFLDFESDACLIITDPDAFKERLSRELTRALPSFKQKAERVEYYDPLCVALTEMRPIFWKHFRHSYQEEVRFAAISPEPTTVLEPVFVNIGSLEDIATLIDTRQQ
ncbi:MAG: hypothetical protein WA096_01120 [Smithella sp.]|jgi:hypothetical protein